MNPLENEEFLAKQKRNLEHNSKREAVTPKQFVDQANKLKIMKYNNLPNLQREGSDGAFFGRSNTPNTVIKSKQKLSDLSIADLYSLRNTFIGYADEKGRAIYIAITKQLDLKIDNIDWDN